MDILERLQLTRREVHVRSCPFCGRKFVVFTKKQHRVWDRHTDRCAEDLQATLDEAQP